MTINAGASSAAITSAALAAASILLFALICERIARRVGAQIERAEAELQQAHDELEVKVEERTRELTRANAILSHALRELRESHEALQRSHVELKAGAGPDAPAGEDGQPRPDRRGGRARDQQPARLRHQQPVRARARGHRLARDPPTLPGGRGDPGRVPPRPPRADRRRGPRRSTSRSCSTTSAACWIGRAGDSMRIQKIVQGLRDFAHLDEADSQEADLNAGVVTTVDLMRPLAEARGVALGTDLAPLPRVTCSPAKINLVIQSLISNAIDASPPGGRVVVRTRPNGDGAEIEVSDQGHGIEPAIRDRVFDPFFTTKPVGQGTGLGLAISYGIVKDHGGAIDFESAPGLGTRFVVRLPRCRPATARRRSKGPSGWPRPDRRARRVVIAVPAQRLATARSGREELMTLALLPILAALAQTPAADTRPNVLVIIADDWSFPHAGVYGDPTVRTPHFDQLAGQGALFTNAYCAAPSCTPSRAAMLTGRMPHRARPGGRPLGRPAGAVHDLSRPARVVGLRRGPVGQGLGPRHARRQRADSQPGRADVPLVRRLPQGRPRRPPVLLLARQPGPAPALRARARAARPGSTRRASACRPGCPIRPRFARICWITISKSSGSTPRSASCSRRSTRPGGPRTRSSSSRATTVCRSRGPRRTSTTRGRASRC